MFPKTPGGGAYELLHEQKARVIFVSAGTAVLP